MANSLVERLKAQYPLITDLLRVSSIPGLSLGVFHHGHIIHTAHFGKRDIDSAQAPDDDSVYYVASTFKVVTASAIARLVTDGVLDWDTPIRNYLPDLHRKDEFGLEATLRDLLSNRTGLPMANFCWGQQNAEQLLPKSEYVKVVDALDAVKPLRSTFICSQWNYCLLQLIVERVTGKAFGSYVRESIFEPLSLQTPTFDDPIGPNIVQPYANLNNGTISRIITSSFHSSTGLSAGTGGKSSLKDQLNLYIALLQAYNYQTTHSTDASPNSPFTYLRTIFSPHIPTPGSTLERQAYCLGLYRTILPGNLSCSSFNGALPRSDLPIFGVSQDALIGEEIFHHTANCPGYIGAMILIPRCLSGIVVMANATPLVDAPDFVVQLLLSTLLGTRPESPRNLLRLADMAKKMQLGWYEQARSVLEGFKTDTPPTHPLCAYAGTYYNKIGNFGIVIAEKDSGLHVSMQGMPVTTYDLRPFDGDSFYWAVDREWEVVHRGMWINPLPQAHIVHFNVDEKEVQGLSWQHDRQMEAEIFVKGDGVGQAKL